MEMSIFERDGKTWTRFRIKIKEQGTWKGFAKRAYGLILEQPVKQNSRFVYFEVQGDYLNPGKKVPR